MADIGNIFKAGFIFLIGLLLVWFHHQIMKVIFDLFETGLLKWVVVGMYYFFVILLLFYVPLMILTEPKKGEVTPYG